MPDITITSMAQQCASAPSMTDVMDAVVHSFATVFELDMQDGDRAVAPAARTPAVAL
jgi:hypothetical protein